MKYLSGFLVGTPTVTSGLSMAFVDHDIVSVLGRRQNSPLHVSHDHENRAIS